METSQKLSCAGNFRVHFEKTSVEREQWLMRKQFKLFFQKVETARGIPNRVVAAVFDRFIPFPEAVIRMPGKGKRRQNEGIDRGQMIERIFRIMPIEPFEIMKYQVMSDDKLCTRAEFRQIFQIGEG